MPVPAAGAPPAGRPGAPVRTWSTCSTRTRVVCTATRSPRPTAANWTPTRSGRRIRPSRPHARRRRGSGPKAGKRPRYLNHVRLKPPSRHLSASRCRSPPMGHRSWVSGTRLLTRSRSYDAPAGVPVGGAPQYERSPRPEKGVGSLPLSGPPRPRAHQGRQARTRTPTGGNPARMPTKIRRLGADGWRAEVPPRLPCHRFVAASVHDDHPQTSAPPAHGRPLPVSPGVRQSAPAREEPEIMAAPEPATPQPIRAGPSRPARRVHHPKCPGARGPARRSAPHRAPPRYSTAFAAWSRSDRTCCSRPMSLPNRLMYSSLSVLGLTRWSRRLRSATSASTTGRWMRASSVRT